PCLLLGDLRPRVAERHSTVEDHRARARVDIHTEVTEALELKPAAHGRAGQAWFRLATAQNLERVRVQVVQEGLSVGDLFGILDREKSIVDTHLDGYGVLP